MPGQHTLFHERRRPDASSETGYVLEQEAPPEEEDTTKAGVAAVATLEALKEEGERKTVRAQYARLLWRASVHGVTLEADDGEEVAVRSLTDKEVADVLGREKTTINARRNELMGGKPEYEACPVVVEAKSRKSYVRGTAHENTTYAINELLVQAARDEDD